MVRADIRAAMTHPQLFRVRADGVTRDLLAADESAALHEFQTRFGAIADRAVLLKGNEK